MIDHNIDVQSVFSWVPKVVRKCESKTLVFLWCGRTAVGRSVGVRSRELRVRSRKIHYLRDSVRKARESHLIDKAMTLEPHGLNRRDELL